MKPAWLPFLYNLIIYSLISQIVENKLPKQAISIEYQLRIPLFILLYNLRNKLEYIPWAGWMICLNEDWIGFVFPSP